MISSGSPHVRCTPMGRTCGEPDEIGLTPMGVEIERLATHTREGGKARLGGLLTSKESGKKFQLGIFLDFASPSTRTEGPHGAYVQTSGRNRIDPHGGEIERLVTRTVLRSTKSDCLLTKKGGNIFWVGIFLDFVWLTTRAPHGAYVRRARRNRIDRHGGEIERPATRTRRRSRASSRPACTCSHEKKSGSIFRVGVFLDFAWLTTRTPHGGASYVRRAIRNRIDPPWGEIERLGTTYVWPSTMSMLPSRYVVAWLPPFLTTATPSTNKYEPSSLPVRNVCRPAKQR